MAPPSRPPATSGASGSSKDSSSSSGGGDNDSGLGLLFFIGVGLLLGVVGFVALLARDMDVVGVVNLNVPTCTNGTVHGIKDVPPAPTTQGADGTPDCSAATQLAEPADDVAAYLAGWASQSELPLDG